MPLKPSRLQQVYSGILSFSLDVNTIGHHFKLYTNKSRHNTRRYDFSHRVVEMWNSLLEYVVTSDTVFEFERKFAHVRTDHPLRWIYTAEEGYKTPKTLYRAQSWKKRPPQRGLFPEEDVG